MLARTLEAAGAIPGVDAAIVSIRDSDDKPIVATLGLSARRPQRQAISRAAERPRGPRDRDLVPVPDAAARRHELVHSGSRCRSRASRRDRDLAVFTRSASHDFEEDEIRELEELAERAGPAIENARRFREARQLADLDALTGLHNRRYFHETLAREVARAHRYSRQLALVVFDLDDFKAINDRIGHLAGDAVLAETAERVRDVVRSADIACRVGGDEFAVILPESSAADADQLYDRLRGAVVVAPARPGRAAVRSRPAIAELLSATTTRPSSSSAPTRRSTARRSSARARSQAGAPGRALRRRS